MFGRTVPNYSIHTLNSPFHLHSSVSLMSLFDWTNDQTRKICFKLLLILIVCTGCFSFKMFWLQFLIPFFHLPLSCFLAMSKKAETRPLQNGPFFPRVSSRAQIVSSSLIYLFVSWLFNLWKCEAYGLTSAAESL